MYSVCMYVHTYVRTYTNTHYNLRTSLLFDLHTINFDSIKINNAGHIRVDAYSHKKHSGPAKQMLTHSHIRTSMTCSAKVLTF